MRLIEWGRLSWKQKIGRVIAYLLGLLIGFAGVGWTLAGVWIAWIMMTR